MGHPLKLLAEAEDLAPILYKYLPTICFYLNDLMYFYLWKSKQRRWRHEVCIKFNLNNKQNDANNESRIRGINNEPIQTR